MEQNAINWAVIGCGVIANEIAQAFQKAGRLLYSVANLLKSCEGWIRMK